MIRPLLIFTFSFLLNLGSFSQKLDRKILNTSWFCSCNFNTDSLILSESNGNKFEWEVRFAPDGKVTLHNLKKNTFTSHYNYSIKKQSLRFFYDHKDSLMNLNYTMSSKGEDGSYKLKTFYELRYKKRKQGDIPPSDNFTLTNGKKKKKFYNLTDITVYRMKKGLKNDSIEYVTKGEFLELHADTMLLNVYQFSEHNFYKKYTDSTHFFSEFLYDSLIKMKIPIKEITKIYSQRDRFNSVINTAAIMALGAFVISLPMALAVKTEPANTVFTRVAVYSALSIPVIVSFNIIFSKKIFQIAPTPKTAKTWRFEAQPGVLSTR